MFTHIDGSSHDTQLGEGVTTSQMSLMVFFPFIVDSMMIVWFLSMLIGVSVAHSDPRYAPSSYPSIQSPYTYKLHLSDCHYVNETECVTQEELRCSEEDKEVCVEVSETECEDEEEEVCTTIQTQDCQEIEKNACATFPTQECKVMNILTNCHF